MKRVLLMCSSSGKEGEIKAKNKLEEILSNIKRQG